MFKKKQVLSVISIVFMSFLIGTMFNTTTIARYWPGEYYDPWLEFALALDNLNNRVDSINASLLELQSSICDGMNVTVTNFPLDEQGNLRVNVTKFSQTYNDVVCIELFHFLDHRDNNIPAYGLRTSDGWLEFPFAFSSRKNANVVDLWIKGVCSWFEGTSTWNVKINGYLTSTTVTIQTDSNNYGVFFAQINNYAFLEAVEPNAVNIIGVKSLDSVILYSLSVIIEYEYQA